LQHDDDDDCSVWPANRFRSPCNQQKNGALWRVHAFELALLDEAAQEVKQATCRWHSVTTVTSNIQKIARLAGIG
jgi:hypothetical protein